MKRAPTTALALGLACCLGMECPMGGTGGLPMGGGPTGTVNQVTGERFIIPTQTMTTDGIGTYQLSEDLGTEVSADMFLNGDASCIDVPQRMKLAVNSAGELLAMAVNRGDCEEIEGYFVNVYADATMLNGTQQPIRTAILDGPQRSFFGDAYLTIDRARDLIYVMSPPVSGQSPFRWKIEVFEGVSTAAFDGMVAPTRTIILPSGFEITEAYLDSDDNFYWIGAGINRLTNMSTRDGTLVSADIDVNEDISAIRSLTMDADERIWALTVVNTNAGEELTAAVQRMGENFGAADIQTLVTYEDFPDSIHVDSRGSVYIEGTGEMRIHDDIASGDINTVQPPSRTVTGFVIGFNAEFIIVY